MATKNQRFAYSSHNAVADTSKMQTEILSISISISFSLSVKPTLSDPVPRVLRTFGSKLEV